ncbi:MAG: antitoxin family protein [Verrucomicrobia bacterium]|nr:antitoxin family protein [Verrucomicrobiota bacterium]
MTTTVEAVYEKGMLKLPGVLPLPDQAHVLVTIQSELEPGLDSERAAWLKLSEETLRRTWDNPDDEVFNELLQK